MSRALSAALAKLGNAEEGTCSSSALTRAQRRALEQFSRETGCVHWRRSGRGWLYEVSNRAVFERHLESLQPDSEASLDPTLNTRARNIATHRDSKASAPQHGHYYLLLKACNEGCIWGNDAGSQLELSESTRAYGLGALQVQPSDSWRSAQPLWLVENQALFDDLSWMPPSVGGSVAYYAGNLANTLLNWLALRPRAPEIILFPDYDGVGLDNYRRLKEAVGEQARFWLMPDWQRLLTRYGNRAIWRQNVQSFECAREALATLAPDDPVHELIEVLAHHGMMLEQEAVPLSALEGPSVLPSSSQ
ncbi:hypothetical protein ACMDCT_13230 [Halomonadaceae bacterium KBTZ08]